MSAWEAILLCEQWREDYETRTGCRVSEDDSAHALYVALGYEPEEIPERYAREVERKGKED